MSTEVPDVHWQATPPRAFDVAAHPSIVSLLETSCRRFAGRPAYHSLGTTLSYGELECLSRDFAGYLQSLGLIKGDRIALMMPNLLHIRSRCPGGT